MQTKSSSKDVAVSGFLRVLLRPGPVPSRAQSWQTQQSELHSSLRVQSARSTRSANTHPGRSHAEQVQGTHQRLRLERSVAQRREATNSRKAPQESRTQRSAIRRLI